MVIYKLDDICFFKNGTTPKTNDKNLWKKEIPFFGPSTLESQITNRWISKNKKNLKRKGTVLISTTATIGNIGILKQISWFNQQITSIEANNQFLLDKYLYYFFIKNKERIKNLKGSGSIFTILKINTFKKWKINLPSIKIQKEIIDIIKPIEIFIEKINLIKEKWLNLMKNQYKISNKKILKIKKIGNVFIGGTPSTKNSKFWNGNIDWINSGSLTNNFISKNINKKITNNAVKKSYKVKNNSLLFSIIDPSKNKISISRSELCINQSIATIISKKILYFEIKDIMWFFNKIKSGSAQQSINKNDILKTKIKLSNIDFSNNFIKLKKIILLQEKLILSKNKILKLLIK